MFYHEASHKGLEFETQIDSHIPDALRGDPIRIKQVLTNLLGNAIKFTDKGKVSLEVSLHSRNVEGDMYQLLFTVSDTGKGISQDKQEAIFEAFSQEDGSISRRYGGTGLGLTISLNLVRLMGGSLWLDSEPGKGSNFYFILPLKKGHAPHLEQEEEQLHALSESPLRLNLLLVEDNHLNHFLLKKILETEGHRVVSAYI